MSGPIRLAVIGLGKIARDQHLPAILESSHFDLVAIVDNDARNVGEIPAFSTVDELAASGIEVDAVSICTPPQVRHDIADAALMQGWHVLLEKPPGATLAEVAALREKADQLERTLFAAWHSRFASAVEPAREWLSEKQIRSAKIIWREDVRVWHPGQAWIWEAGGFGVFDPGINALSIITRILPDPLFVVGAKLEFHANLAAPIAARLTLRDRKDAPVEMDFDFREEGPQQWNIEVETDGGVLRLTDGGANIFVDGRELATSAEALHGEYPSLYDRFATLIREGGSEVDIAPLRLVADSFLRGKIEMVEPFHE